MILINDQQIKFKQYSDGAIDLIETGHLLTVIYSGNETSINITANIKSSSDLMELILTKAFIDNFNKFKKQTKLLLPYVPYMRSDRAMVPGRSIGGLKAIAPLINNLKFDSVQVIDPHSDVVEALITNVQVIKQDQALNSFVQTYSDVFKDIDFIVSPDQGAMKKIDQCSKVLSKPYIEAFKVREINTNKILKTSVMATDEVLADLKGKSVLIIDDIIEGGRTFLALAKMLKENYQVKEVNLYTTHGLFTFGWEHLKEYIDNVYCYYSWLPCEEVSKTQGYIKTKEYF